MKPSYKRFLSAIIILVIGIPLSCFSQNQRKVDSLEKVLLNAEENMDKVTLLFKLEGQLYLSVPDKALKYNEQALALSLRLNYEKGEGPAHNNMGIIFWQKGEYPKALKHFHEAEASFEKLGNKRMASTVLNNIGGVYWNQQDLDRALEYFKQSLALKKELGDKRGIAYSYIGIGVVYKEQAKEAESESKRRARYATALEYYQNAMKLMEDLQDSSVSGNEAMGDIYNNLGSLYQGLESYSIALGYYKQSLKMREKNSDKAGIAGSHRNIGGLHALAKQTNDAIYHWTKGLEVAMEAGALLVAKGMYEDLAILYADRGEFMLACAYDNKFNLAKDNLFNEEKSKDLGRIEAKYEIKAAETERKRLEEEIRVASDKAERRRNNLQYSGILIFMVLLIAALVGVASGRKMMGIKVPLRLMEGLIFFVFLLFFEFTLVLLDPYIELYSAGAPAIKLAFNAILAALIFPLHSFFEEKMTMRIKNS